MSEKRSTPRAETPPWVGFLELSADHLPPAQRLEFWYETTGRRMECRYAAQDGRLVRTRLQALVQHDIEFMEYQSDAFTMRRDKRQCRRDDHDEISIGLVMSPRSGAVQDGGELPLQHGDLYVVDFGRPVDSMTLEHHELAIMLPRRLVKQVLGCATDALGGHKLPLQGVGGLLAAHMNALSREARFLTPAQQRIALQAASDLALATLQGANPDSVLDSERFSGGLYAAACRIIRQHCVDHTFDAEKLAERLGCSRATLYRLFAGREQSVAGMIWMARLDYAQRMLQSLRYRNLSVSDIAQRCGFLDMSTFSRMYKARYGVRPKDVRR